MAKYFGTHDLKGQVTIPVSCVMWPDEIDEFEKTWKLVEYVDTDDNGNIIGVQYHIMKSGGNTVDAVVLVGDGAPKIEVNA